MPSQLSTVGTALERARAVIRWFVGVAARKRTYANMAYLFLSFPLGIGYFTVSVTGFAIPIGLTFAVVDIARTEPATLLIAGIPIGLVMICLGIPVAFCTLAASIEFVPEFTYRHEGWTIDISPITLSIADGELISLYVDSIAASLAVSAVGVLVGLVVLHLFSAVAWLLARYTGLLLRNTQPSIFSEPPEI